MSKEIEVSWCDKLSSTPAVGFELDPHFAASESVISSLSPMLDSWRDGKKANFNITRLEAFLVHIQHEEGFLYAIEPNRVSVTFQHRMKFRSVSGGLPIGELISSASPYTDLLDEVINRLIDVSRILPNIDKRKVTRIGIVTTTSVLEDDMPPGIRHFVNFLNKPWPNGLESFKINLIANLDENENSRDRCTHTLHKPEEEGELMNLIFDWQRYTKKPLFINGNSIEREVGRSKDEALKYFETLAVGDAFDESILGNDN